MFKPILLACLFCLSAPARAGDLQSDEEKVFDIMSSIYIGGECLKLGYAFTDQDLEDLRIYGAKVADEKHVPRKNRDMMWATITDVVYANLDRDVCMLYRSEHIEQQLYPFKFSTKVATPAPF